MIGRAARGRRRCARRNCGSRSSATAGSASRSTCTASPRKCGSCSARPKRGRGVRSPTRELASKQPGTPRSSMPRCSTRLAPISTCASSSTSSPALRRAGSTASSSRTRSPAGTTWSRCATCGWWAPTSTSCSTRMRRRMAASANGGRRRSSGTHGRKGTAWPTTSSTRRRGSRCARSCRASCARAGSARPSRASVSPRCCTMRSGRWRPTPPRR